MNLITMASEIKNTTLLRLKSSEKLVQPPLPLDSIDSIFFPLMKLLSRHSRLIDIEKLANRECIFHRETFKFSLHKFNQTLRCRERKKK